MKFAGYDHLVIRGKAERPVTLVVRDDEVTIRDASHLWGCDTYETAAGVRKDLNDPAAAVVCIGPVGERRVVYAAIMSPIGNAAARMGLEAVMGAKNLKAVAVRRTRGPSPARRPSWCRTESGRMSSIWPASARGWRPSRASP